MDQHPEYGLSLIKDNYNAFQPDSFNKDECTKLRADKWKTCHPNNSDLPPCTADMTIEQLHSLFKKHKSCYHFRAAENKSLCFDTPDPGHIKAERIELNHTEQCRILLEAKDTHPAKETKSKGTKKSKDSKKQPKGIEENGTNSLMSNDHPLDIKLPPNMKWWVYLLGIVAIIGIGFFLFYVY